MPDADDGFVWVRCELRRLSPRWGLMKPGDIARVPQREAVKFGRFVTVFNPDDRVDVWEDDDG